MAFLTIEIDAAEVEAVRAALNPRQFRQAMYQAVKRTVERGVLPAVIKNIEEQVSVDVNDLLRHRATKGAIEAHLSKGDIPVGEVRISGKALPMTAFDYKASKKNGVVVVMSKNRAPIILKHAFEARMKSGHVGIFQRRMVNGKPSARLPIKEAYGPSLPSLIERPSIEGPLMKELQERLYHELQGQVNRFLSPVNAGGL